MNDLVQTAELGSPIAEELRVLGSQMDLLLGQGNKLDELGRLDAVLHRASVNTHMHTLPSWTRKTLVWRPFFFLGRLVRCFDDQEICRVKVKVKVSRIHRLGSLRFLRSMRRSGRYQVASCAANDVDLDDHVEVSHEDARLPEDFTDDHVKTIEAKGFSPQASFHASKLTCVRNFRDISCFAEIIRPGIIFRSAAPAVANKTDAQYIISHLNIRVRIDIAPILCINLFCCFNVISFDL
jgi:hypothetical protein